MKNAGELFQIFSKTYPESSKLQIFVYIHIDLRFSAPHRTARQSRGTISAKIATFEITKWRNLIENICLHFYSESWKTSKIKISEIMKLEWKKVKIPFKMGSSFYNKNRMVLADYMNSYFSHKSTDCTIYSDDGYEFPIHKVSFYILWQMV